MVSRKLVYALGAALALAVSGCGGSSSLGRNSTMSIHLIRTDGTQNLTTFDVAITRNAALSYSTLDPESYASTTNTPSWISNYSVTRSSTELVLNYTTRFDQPPYYVFISVPNTGAAFETLKFRVDVDGTTGATATYNMPINATTRLTTVVINRNTASY